MNFARELKKLWNVRVTAIPVVIGTVPKGWGKRLGALGTVPRGWGKRLGALGTVPKGWGKRLKEWEIRGITEII